MLSVNLQSHLQELRRRFLFSALLLLIVLIGTMPFANVLYTWLAKPLLADLPQKTLLISSLTHAFSVPFKLSIYLSIFIAMPFFLYQCFAFIAPALYQQEKKIFRRILCVSILLFYFGVALAYVVIFPLLFHWLVSFAPEGATVMPDISTYLDLCMHLFLVFGLIFEIPVVVFILVYAKIVHLRTLRHLRPYVIVSAFILGMLLTPPDIISQIALAIPLCLLFEIALAVCHFFIKED